MIFLQNLLLRLSGNKSIVLVGLGLILLGCASYRPTNESPKVIDPAKEDVLGREDKIITVDTIQ